MLRDRFWKHQKSQSQRYSSDKCSLNPWILESLNHDTAVILWCYYSSKSRDLSEAYIPQNIGSWGSICPDLWESLAFNFASERIAHPSLNCKDILQCFRQPICKTKKPIPALGLWTKRLQSYPFGLRSHGMNQLQPKAVSTFYMAST